MAREGREARKMGNAGGPGVEWVTVRSGQVGHAVGGGDAMTMLFFLGAGWLATKYPLPTPLVVATGPLLKHPTARRSRAMPR